MRRHFSPAPSALVASAAPATLGLELTQFSPGDRAAISLNARLGPTMPFSLGFSTDTWEEWTVVHEALTGVGGTLMSSHIGGTSYRANGYEGPDEEWYVAAEFMDGYWMFKIGARSEQRLTSIRDMLSTLAGEAPMLGDDTISMSIWTYNAAYDCGNERYGRMKVGPWAEVMANYPAEVREQLEALATALPDKSEGGIVLLGGDAGTGKTRAFEALCHAWAAFAKLGVVVDSDKMLGSAGYMTDVITSVCSDQRQVIVAEDCDDMVKAGPKSAETAKMLNIADGMVGRLAGAGTVLALSANMPMDDIAPYIRRPGRAAAAIEFRPFGIEEADAWFEANEIEARADRDLTLAEMFEIARKIKPAA